MARLYRKSDAGDMAEIPVTAEKVEHTITVNGQSFDGSADVTVDMLSEISKMTLPDVDALFD